MTTSPREDVDTSGGGGERGEWDTERATVRTIVRDAQVNQRKDDTYKERQQRGHRTYIRHKLRSTNARMIMIRKEGQHRTYFGTSHENTHCRWAAEMMKCDTAVSGLSL
ncbi:unnamed protein product, partial [Ectocarpus sp. 13 AM-2016]